MTGPAPTVGPISAGKARAPVAIALGSASGFSIGMTVSIGGEPWWIWRVRGTEIVAYPFPPPWWARWRVSFDLRWREVIGRFTVARWRWRRWMRLDP